MRTALLILGLTVAGCTVTPVPQAQQYPGEAIEIAVPQEPGSSLDVTTRVMADGLQKVLGVPVVVSNVVGAGGRLAYAKVFTANPDGYYLGNANVLSLSIGEVVLGGQYKTDQFEYVYAWNVSDHVLAVRHDSPITDLESLIQHLRTKRTTIGTFGNGTSSHFQMAAFVKSLDVKNNAAFVHFEGGGLALGAVVGKNVDVAIVGDGAYVRKPAEVRGVVLFGNMRNPRFPDLATIGELGYKNVPIVSQPIGILAPPGTPADRIQKLSDALDQVAKTDAVVEQFKKLGLELTAIPAAQLRETAGQLHRTVTELKEVLN